MTPADVLKLYSTRDKLSRAEKEIERSIFRADGEWDDAARKAIIRQYQRAKDKRTLASIRAADAFMQLTPEERAIVTDQWQTSREGMREDGGVGQPSGVSDTSPNDPLNAAPNSVEDTPDASTNKR